jgi:hypothetical protein
MSESLDQFHARTNGRAKQLPLWGSALLFQQFSIQNLTFQEKMGKQ